jgi:hypothetical protein
MSFPRLALLLPLLTVFAAPAQASPQATAVPAADGQGRTHLELRVIAYDGHTNGGMTVEVTNTGAVPETFAAQGLFFVPDGNPNEAPQRLGAVGPFRIDGDDGRKDKVALLPGKKIVVQLDVYCIASHRSSPGPQTQFHLSPSRMPRELSTGINQDARAASQSYGGLSAPAAKSAVQSEVWKNRNKKWIKLDGEGRQEVGK